MENTKMKGKHQTGIEWNQKMFTSLKRGFGVEVVHIKESV